MSEKNQARAHSPLVDVVLPVRNYATFLPQSIQSVLAQTASDLRLIVVDYGSTDNTLDIVEGFARADPRVHVIKLTSGTLVDALKAGCGAATAPFIARQDADDVSDPARFAAQLEVLQKTPNVVAVSGACTHIDAAGRDLPGRFEAPDPEDIDFNDIPAREPLLLQPFVMMKRQAYLAAGGYRDAFNCYSEDSDLFWRLARIGRLVNLPFSLGRMRTHPGSITNTSTVNGRLIAIFSQLAALSARRLHRGLADIDFSQIDAEELRKAASLERMLALVSRALDHSERKLLACAATVKLLELAVWRSFELDIDDCRLAARVYAEMDANALQGRCVANWAYRTTFLRFIRTGRFAHAAALGGLHGAARITALRAIPRQQFTRAHAAS